jgi:DNA-directed RNA polymerase specialized sigma24 family protein
MNASPTSSLSNEDALALYERLLANDPTAPSDLAVAYLDSLTDWLIKHNRRLHPNDCATAAEDAILALLKNPMTYNPKRQTLHVYLRMSAQRDLQNLLNSAQRRNKHRAGLEALVELSPVVRKYVQEQANPETVLERRESEATLNVDSPPISASVQAGLTPGEAKVLELMEVKERKTSVYAVALGISPLSFEEQKKEVKRVKDRLKKRLERVRSGDG